MARHIPPRRVPRDRFVFSGGGTSGSVFSGVVPGAHTHLEVDITDLDKYTQAAADAKFVDVAGDTMTGPLVLSLNAPSVRYEETDAALDEKRWEWTANSALLFLGAVDDARTVNTHIYEVTRTGATPDLFTVNIAAQFDGILNVIGALTEGGTQVSLVGHTHVEADITDLKAYLELAGGTLTGDLTLAKTQPGIRMNATGTSNSFIAWQDDGSSKFIMGWKNSETSFKLNIGSSLAARSDFVMDAAGLVTFGTTPEVGGTAVSLAGHTHLEADITDLRDYLLKTGGTLTGNLAISASSPTFIMENTVGNADAKKWRWIAETGAGRLRLATLTDAGGVGESIITISRSGTAVTLIQFENSPVFKLADGMIWEVRDSSNLDIVTLRHNGIDFRIIGTNTTNLRLTGMDLKIEDQVGFNNTNPIAKPTVTGSRAGNAALASLLTALANYGLITDSST